MENLSDTYHDPSHRFPKIIIGRLTPPKIKNKSKKFRGEVITIRQPTLLFSEQFSSSNFHQFPVLVGNAYSAEKFGPFQVSSLRQLRVWSPFLAWSSESCQRSPASDQRAWATWRRGLGLWHFWHRSVLNLYGCSYGGGTADWADVFLLSHISHLGSCFELLQISHEAHDFCIPWEFDFVLFLHWNVSGWMSNLCIGCTAFLPQSDAFWDLFCDLFVRFCWWRCQELSLVTLCNPCLYPCQSPEISGWNRWFPSLIRMKAEPLVKQSLCKHLGCSVSFSSVLFREHHCLYLGSEVNHCSIAGHFCQYSGMLQHVADDPLGKVMVATDLQWAQAMQMHESHVDSFCI